MEPMKSANAAAPDTRKLVVKDALAKWNKLSEKELAAVKGKSDLVTLLQSRYGFDQAKAEQEIEQLFSQRTQ